MKQVRLNLMDWLNKVQDSEDKGMHLEANDDMPTLTIGVYVKDIETRFCCPISEIKRFDVEHKIDESIYHGKALELAKGFNKVIAEHVPWFVYYPQIRAEMYRIAESRRKKTP